VTAKRRAQGPAVKRKPKAPGTTKRRWMKVLKWGLIAGLAGTLLLVGGFVYLYKTTAIPDPNKDFQTQSSFVYYNDGKTEVGQYATQNRQIIPLSDVPANLQNAVIAAEDRTF
jgi:membrane peptidoglycan carboxypeptidase